MTPLYRASGPVTLVGGGPISPSELEATLALAPEAVAADSGGDVSLPGAAAFRAVIGDMDLLTRGPELRRQGVPLHPVPEQDTTDLEKCLALVEAPLFLGVGFLEGRIDHHLAAMNALAKFPDKRAVLIGGTDLCFLCPAQLDLDLAAGTRVSFFPMASVAGTLCEGLRWSVAGLEFAPDRRIGTSNVTLGGRVSVAFDRRAMLVILPAEHLETAIASLGRTVARSPRRVEEPGL